MPWLVENVSFEEVNNLIPKHVTRLGTLRIEELIWTWESGDLNYVTELQTILWNEMLSSFYFSMPVCYPF